jgi:hypothetical protein
VEIEKTLDCRTDIERGETIDDYAGEAVLDRYIDPEEMNTDR